MNEFQSQQKFLVRQAMVQCLADTALSTQRVDAIAGAITSAVEKYKVQLAADTLWPRDICTNGRQLAHELANLGIDHATYMELAKQLMALGYGAGFFGIYIDYSLAADRGDL